MFLPEGLNFYILLSPLLLVTLVATFWQMRRHEKSLQKQKKEINQRIYETLILREIGERIGYELNIGKILDTIITSLNNLVPFTGVSYMLIAPNGGSVDFKVHLAQSVNQKFIDTLREHLLSTLNQVSPKKFETTDLQLSITGAIIDEVNNQDISSLWVVPLTINNRGLGALAIASNTAGLYRGPEMDILVKIISQANHAVNNLEKIIATEQERINSMVTSMPDGVLMFGKELELLVVNPAVEQLLGLPTEPKPTIFDIAKSLADKIDLRSKIDESNSTKKVVEVEDLILKGKYSKLLISPVYDHAQNQVGTVVVFHDRTAQMQLEQLREEFTAMMVHELRAPLTVVRGATDMFIRNQKMIEQPDGLELLKTMQTSATTMLTLVNDLLDVAKIEAGKFQIIKTLNNLGEIIKAKVIFFSQLSNPKSISLITDISDQNIMAQFDRDRMAQVFNNLLSNAIKFTPVGGKITVSASQISSGKDIKWRYSMPYDYVEITTPCILVSVSDNGRGVASEKISELFSKFRQLHSSGEEKGTGLGLVIAKGIIESHGGQIFLESRPNEGTTFYFTIPI